MADILASMAVRLAAETTQFERDMAAAKKELRGFVKYGESLKSTGGNVTAGVTAPLLALGGLSVKVGSDFESAFNRVEAATLASGLELDSLRNKAKDISLDPDLKFSATESAQALENLAKNGLSTAQILGGAADASVNLATATGGQLATAADITTDVMNNFGRSAGEAANLVSNITGTTIASKLSIDEYAGALGQAGGVVGQLGVRFEDFNTALAVTSSGFSSGSDAGTSFKTFIQRLVPQSNEAAAAMQKLGLKFFDAQGKMRPLREIAGELQRAFKGLSDQQRTQLGTQIFGADSIRTALLLAKDGTAGFDKMAESIGKVNAATQGAILSKGFAGGLESLKSAAEGAGIAIAESGLLNFADRIVRGGADLLTYVAKLDPAIIRMGLGIAGAAATVGPLAVGLGSLGVALPAITAGAGALGLALGPVAAVAAGVGLAAYIIIDNWEELVDYFTIGEGGRVWEELSRAVRQSMDAISGALDRVDFGGSFADLIAGTGIVQDAFEEIAVGITAVLDTITGVVRTVSALLRGDWVNAWDGAKQVVLGTFAPITNALGLSTTALREFLNVQGEMGGTGQGPRIEPANPFLEINKGLGGYVALAADAGQASQELSSAVVTAGGKLSMLSDEQVKALAKLREALALNAGMSRALGISYNQLAGEQSALEAGVKSLVAAGFDPAGRTVQRYAQRLNALKNSYADLSRIELRLPAGITPPTGETPKIKFEADFGSLPTSLPSIDVSPFTGSLGEATAQMVQFQLAGEMFTEGLNQALVGGLYDVATGIGDAVGQMMLGAGGVELVGAAILGGIGGMAIDLGKLAIGVGIATAGIKAALESLNPVAAIAGGIALVALGTAVKGAASRIGGGGGAGRAGSTFNPATAAPARTPEQRIKIELAPVLFRQKGTDLEALGQVSKYRQKRLS